MACGRLAHHRCPARPMRPTLHDCLRARPAAPEITSADHWCADWWASAAQGGTAFDLAVRSGFRADRLAWAFASGHQAAIRALLPGVAPQQIVAFCLTEPGGNRPQDLRTTRQAGPDGGWRIDGEKHWATLGPLCTDALVMTVPAVEAAGPRRALRLLRVGAGTPGLQIEPMPPTAFVPELPHARIHLRQVAVPATARLPGDGWECHGKPFRTLEDQLVTAAVLALLLREARALDWPADFRQRLLATLHALCHLSDAGLHEAAGHLGLAGALAWAGALYAEASALWAATPEAPAAQRWQRDAPLLALATGTRAQRAARAWQQLAAPLA